MIKLIITIITMSKILLEATLMRNYGFKRFEKYDVDSDCTICTDTLLNSPVLQLECGHTYHIDCILEAIAEYGARQCFELDCHKEYDYKPGSK